MNNDKLRFCYNVVSVTSVNKLWFMGVGMGKVDYRGLAPTFCRGAPCWWSLQLQYSISGHLIDPCTADAAAEAVYCMYAVNCSYFTQFQRYQSNYLFPSQHQSLWILKKVRHQKNPHHVSKCTIVRRKFKSFIGRSPPSVGTRIPPSKTSTPGASTLAPSAFGPPLSNCFRLPDFGLSSWYVVMILHCLTVRHWFGDQFCRRSGCHICRSSFPVCARALLYADGSTSGWRGSSIVRWVWPGRVLQSVEPRQCSCSCWVLFLLFLFLSRNQTGTAYEPPPSLFPVDQFVNPCFCLRRRICCQSYRRPCTEKHWWLARCRIAYTL